MPKLVDSYRELLEVNREAQKLQRESLKQSAAGLLGMASLVCAGGGVGLVIASFDATKTIEKTHTDTSGHLWWKHTKVVVDASTTVDVPMHTRLAYLFCGIILLALATVCIATAARRIATQRRLKRYPAILKGHEAIKIQQIVDITGSSRTTVYRDLQTLISTDAITDLYIDYAADLAVNKKYIPEASHKTVVKCSECGGNNDLIVGITKSCSFCGQPLLVART